MAVSICGEESKRMRKMSLTYIKDSIVRRSGRQNGSRSRVFSEDANGETPDSCSKDMSSEGNGERSKCTGRPLADKHKLGIFKSLKKRFQITTNVGSRAVKCKSKQTFRSVESSNYSLSLSEESASDGFSTCSTRKSKGGSIRSICPAPTLPFVKGTSSDKCSPISLTSRHKEEVHTLPKVPDVIQNACKFHSIPTLESENGLVENDICLSTSESNIDSNKDYVPGLSRRDTCVTYRDTHNFVLNINRGGNVCYEPYDIIGHAVGKSPEAVQNSTSRSLTCELFKLAKYGWYWGPISREEAEEKLLDLPDGAFLVRDSSADRYLLSVSFRSSGKTFHTRIEHSYGLFSFYQTTGAEGFASIVDLINYSMSYSESAVFCYSRPRAPGYPAFPVRLAKPVSRFTQVRSLQYLCRFVIRQYTRVDNIQKLPLPTRLKGYIQEGHY